MCLPGKNTEPCIHNNYTIAGVYRTMAFWRRGDVAQAFRNNPNLQQFMLTDVTSTDRILGTGSYGSVVEVSKSTGSLELSN